MNKNYVCPNCGGNILSAASECSSCGATFLTAGGWTPIPEDQRPIEEAPRFSGIPKLMHAGQSVLLFAAFGPPVGLLLLTAFWQELSGERRMWFFLIGILGCYIPGLIPALIAGMIYWIAALTLVNLFSKPTIRAPSGAVIGLFAGVIAGMLYHHIVAMTIWGGTSTTVGTWMKLCGISGLLCGLLSARLLPIGKPQSSVTRGGST